MIELYDPAFIENTVLQNLENNLTVFKPILNYLNQKATRHGGSIDPLDSTENIIHKLEIA